MRRAGMICLIAALLLTLLPCAGATAADGLYCEYVSRSEKGTVFYIDVYADTDISAAVAELSFDSAVAEFRSVSAEKKTSSVRYRAEDGAVRIAFADSASVSGKVFRVSFKALSAGTCRFTLRTEQAVDGSLNDLGALGDFTLTVTLGKADVTSKSAEEKKAASGKSSSGKSSTKTELSTSPDDEYETPGRSAVDVSADQRWTFFALGAGAVALAAALVLLGIMIGRKTRKKNTPQDPQDSETQQGEATRQIPDAKETAAETQPDSSPEA